MVVQTQRARVRQRPARLSALLHRLPGVPRTPWNGGPGDSPGVGSRSPSCAPIRAGAHPDRLGPARRPLPAPAHLAFSLARYRHLALGERARVARAVLALRKLSLEDPGLDSETFAAFLARNGQSRGAIERLWDLITLPTVNLRADEASLTLGAKVFRTGLIDRTDAADVGWARVPLDALHVDPAAALLERLGGLIRLRAKVDAVDLADDGPKTITGVVVDGEHVEADAVVLAVPHRVAAGRSCRRGAS